MGGSGRGEALRVGGGGRDLHTAQHDPAALQCGPGAAGAADLGGEPDLQGVRVERPGATGERARVRAQHRSHSRAGRELSEEEQGAHGTKSAVVSYEFARKVATEKETPYTRWVRDEGLDIVSSFYVPNLHTVELKPWPRRGGRGVYLNHDASRTSNDCYVCQIPPGGELAPQRQLFEEMIYVLDGRGSTAVWNDAGQKITFEWKAGSLFAIPLNAWHQHFN